MTLPRDVPFNEVPNNIDFINLACDMGQCQGDWIFRENELRAAKLLFHPDQLKELLKCLEARDL